MLHRADVQRTTAAAAMQHARASQGERPHRQEAACTSTTRKNPRNGCLRIGNIYIAARENTREGEKGRIVVCQIRNHEMKKGREENKERMGSKTVNLIFYRWTFTNWNSTIGEQRVDSCSILRFNVGRLTLKSKLLDHRSGALHAW